MGINLPFNLATILSQFFYILLSFVLPLSFYIIPPKSCMTSQYGHFKLDSFIFINLFLFIAPI